MPATRRDRDLRQPEPEHRAPHRAQLRQAELEPDREHQEHDAELGELARRRVVGHDAERVRPERDADDQVAEDRRQPHAAADATTTTDAASSSRISSSVWGIGCLRVGGDRTLSRRSARMPRSSRTRRRYTLHDDRSSGCCAAMRATPRSDPSTRSARSRSPATCSTPRRARSRRSAQRLGAPFVAARRADASMPRAASSCPASASPATSRASSPRRSRRPARRRSSCIRPKRATATSA